MNRFIQTQPDNGQSSSYNNYISHPLLSLTIAMKPLLSSIEQLDDRTKRSKIYCHHPSSHNLTKDESAAVYLYTEELNKQTLHSTLNRALRSGKISMIEPWFGFLKLFNTALEKLPTVNGTIWRGMYIDIAMNLRENEDIIWGSVSSCSISMDIIKSYLDSNSVLCSIEAINGKSICGYTGYIKEDEVLLLPGTRLRVTKNDCNASTGLRVVHLVEICNGSHNMSLSTDNFIPSRERSSEHDSSKYLHSFLKYNHSLLIDLCIIVLSISIISLAYNFTICNIPLYIMIELLRVL
jgi:hypothetical protein